METRWWWRPAEGLFRRPGSERIRLYGIDAPESSQQRRKGIDGTP